MEFEQQTGPIHKGDLLVIEVNGKLVPKVDKTGPQWFVVTCEERESGRIDMETFNAENATLKPKRYVASGFKLY